jgi:putative glycosyltransferase (TIGR04348 family)
MITPMPPRSRSGNRTTAMRWTHILRKLGHRVRVAVEYDGRPADLMIALHAWRSAAAIEDFHRRYPDRPLVVALTGTDIYRFIHSHRQKTLRSLDLAHRLVGLHRRVADAIPRRYHDKLDIIYQSAPRQRRRRPANSRWFDVLVIGHLRAEKDPLRAALAARRLPQTSRLRIIHLGGAHDARWAARARAEMARNPRYLWRGEVPNWRVRHASARASLMVLSSVMEGGANVISEAVMAGLPVIASRIAGSVGLLGHDYPGYYRVGDSAALARQLRRAEQSPDFLAELRRHCAARANLFEPRGERKAWRKLIRRLGNARSQ